MLAKNIQPKQSISKEVFDSLRLIRSENVGIKTFYDLVRVFGNATNAIENVQELSLRGGRKKPINVFSKTAIQEELDKLEAYNTQIICYNSKQYPELLKKISDPPPIINAKGNISLLNTKAVAIVGSRSCSLAGIQFTQKLSRELANLKITVVSGFARGIDTAAHKASISNGTIAVLAGGIDHIYPAENKELYNEISEKGCIVAELPIGSAPSSQHFPQRNRIISGLSLAVAVIEASIASGSLITANLALEQGREVLAVPGFPTDPRYKGNNKLLKQGASILESVDDIIDNLSHVNFAQTSGMSDQQYKLNDRNDNSSFMTSQTSNISDSMRKDITSLLSTTPVEIQEIVNHIQLPLSIIYTILLELELAGKLNRHPGNKVSIKISP